MACNASGYLPSLPSSLDLGLCNSENESNTNGALLYRPPGPFPPPLIIRQPIADDFDQNDRPPPEFWMKWNTLLSERGFAFYFGFIMVSGYVRAPPWHAFAKRISDSELRDSEPFLVKYSRKFKFPQEGHLVQRLITEPFRAHPYNRIPYIAVIDVGNEGSPDGSPDAFLLVSALCSGISTSQPQIPQLTRKEDFLDIFDQITQTINFLHSNGIAHCDIYYANLLMQRQPYQWYLIDFGSAVFYDPTDLLAVRPLVNGKHRTARHDYPDYQSGGSFDPFAFDVYCWGGWISLIYKVSRGLHTCFTMTTNGAHRYDILDFPALQQLADEMTHSEPHMRPSSDVVLRRLTQETSNSRAILRLCSQVLQEPSWPKRI